MFNKNCKKKKKKKKSQVNLCPTYYGKWRDIAFTVVERIRRTPNVFVWATKKNLQKPPAELKSKADFFL